MSATTTQEQPRPSLNGWLGDHLQDMQKEQDTWAKSDAAQALSNWANQEN